ncbi:MAG: GerMN domain-containing protein, partial [Thermoanaerobaculia bacterium]
PFLLFLVIACAQEAPVSAPAPAPVPDPVPAPAPSTAAPTPVPAPVAAERNIYIDRVEVANPLVVSGRARTFENNVVLRVRAADGSVISETFTTSEGEMGRHNPYRATLWLTRDPGNRVLVEALEYSAKDGSETNLVREEKSIDIAPIEARLHFPDQTCTNVKPYTRRMPKSVSLARLLVEALIAGPLASERNAGAAAPFPQGSRVQSVNLRDGTLTVDFNERLQNVGGACQAQMIRAAVTETLRQLPSVQRVVITAGGSEKLALQP